MVCSRVIFCSMMSFFSVLFACDMSIGRFIVVQIEDICVDDVCLESIFQLFETAIDEFSEFIMNYALILSKQLNKYRSKNRRFEEYTVSYCDSSHRKLAVALEFFSLFELNEFL